MVQNTPESGEPSRIKACDAQKSHLNFGMLAITKYNLPIKIAWSLNLVVHDVICVGSSLLLMLAVLEVSILPNFVSQWLRWYGSARVTCT